MPAVPDGRTWYVVMGVEPGAPQAEVRAAYLRLARSLHPDRHESGTPTERGLAERRMREVNEAWSVLGNSTSRAEYDRGLQDPQRVRKTAAPPRSPQSPPWTTTRPEQEPRVETIWRDSRRPSYFAGTRGTGPQPVQVVVEDEDDEDEDMVPMRAHEVFLLRRLPVLIAIAVGLAIFIGTAYIGSSNTSNNPSPFRFPTTIACHTVEPGSC